MGKHPLELIDAERRLARVWKKLCEKFHKALATVAHPLLNARSTDQNSGLASGSQAETAQLSEADRACRGDQLAMSITVESSLQILASRILRQLLIALAVLGFAGGRMQAQDNPVSEEKVEQAAGEGEHAKHEGLPLNAVRISNQRAISPTNSMIVTWLVALGIIIFARVATRRIKEVGSSRVDLQACKLEYSIVSPK